MKQRSTTQKTLKLFWQHVWRYPFYTIGDLATTPLTIIVDDYLPPLVLASVLNRLAKGNFQPHNLWSSFGVSFLLYVGLLICGSVGYRLLDAFNWRLEANVQRDMAQRVYDHLLDQSANFHANTFGGSLVSQTNKFLGAYVRFADTTLLQVINLFAGLIFTMIILAHRAPLYVTVLLVVAIFWIVSSSFATRKVRQLNAKHANLESQQTGYLADSITNVLAIKSFAGGHFERKRFADVTKATRRGMLNVMQAHQGQMVYFSILSRAAEALAFIAAVVGAAIFKANIATTFLIFSYTSSLISSLWTFSNSSLRNYNRAFGDAADMTEILQLEPEVKDSVEPEDSRISRGAITFENVNFTHEGAGGALFHNLNVLIKPGEKVGLVGSSGSGKTTFTRLLLRFSDIDGGEILIDGQNIAHLAQDDLRQHIAYVPQEPIMFHRSLKENIRYGQFDASDEAVYGAAKIAHAHDFIVQLPRGYETLVGERGVKLSGGQRQRVAIARAMLKNAPILVLDEATSALDSESEVLIQDSLWKLMEGRTAIVIAHRLSTIQKMDRIVVLDEGTIVEQGSHKELLRLNGTYARLWAHQSGGFIEE